MHAIQAQMSRCSSGTGWRVYIVLSGRTDWPEVRLPGDHVPLTAERDQALQTLGYTATTEEWSWTEDETTGVVRLIAFIPVTPA